MKKNLLTFSILLACIFSSHASIVTIFAGQDGPVFTPAVTTVSVGDTVRFVRSGGTHTTTSVSVPSGAASWDSPLSANVTQFDYKVTHEGTYSYVCTPHAGIGMVGSFSTVSTGINNEYEAIKSSFSVTPNPVVDNTTIRFSSPIAMKGSIKVLDAAGNFVYEEKMKVESGDNVLSFNAQKLKSGLYYLNLLDKENTFLVVKMVKQ